MTEGVDSGETEAGNVALPLCINCCHDIDTHGVIALWGRASITL